MQGQVGGWFDGKLKIKMKRAKIPLLSGCLIWKTLSRLKYHWFISKNDCDRFEVAFRLRPFQFEKYRGNGR